MNSIRKIVLQKLKQENIVLSDKILDYEIENEKLFDLEEQQKNYLKERMLIEYERDMEYDSFRKTNVEQSYDFIDL
jgi:hypothetical protein